MFYFALDIITIVFNMVLTGFNEFSLKSIGLQATRGNEVYASHTVRARKSRKRLFVFLLF